MSSIDAASRCGRLELVASRGITTPNPWANPSVAVARMHTFVLTPATRIVAMPCSWSNSARSVAKNAE